MPELHRIGITEHELELLCAGKPIEREIAGHGSVRIMFQAMGWFRMRAAVDAAPWTPDAMYRGGVAE